MAKLILKAPYYKPNHKTATGQSRGGYAMYIAKRDGVEIPRSGMVNYIGERRGSHGLFTDEGEKINLSAVETEMDSHPGNIWGFIISLKREDAERLGYNSAEQWMNLLRSRRNDIAKEMHISPCNLRWYAAYHNAETHPHVHMMVWSKEPREPYLSTEGIHNIKHTLASDIFRQELISVYRKQTEARDDIKDECRERIKQLSEDIRKGNITFSPEVVQRLAVLSERLSKKSGKKVYGYLDKTTKNLVNSIVKLLAQDEKISSLYDSWYELKCETVRTYTDVMPDKIPLEENDEFKSVRNQVVSAAASIGSVFSQPERDIDYEYPKKDGERLDFEYLKFEAEFTHDPMVLYRLGRYYLDKTDDMDEAEYWLKLAGDNGIGLASYLVYKGYRDERFNEHPADKMKYLRKAVDAGFGYAEYQYAMLLKDKDPDSAMEYLQRASEHGSFQAEYAMGKLLLEQGKVDEAMEYFESSARKDAWTKTAVGLLYYYEFGEHEKGEEYLHSAADQGYAPAEEALKAIRNHLNAQLVIGVCDLFYYASNIIEDRAADMYSNDHQVSDHGMERRARRERLAKQNGWRMGGM